MFILFLSFLVSILDFQFKSSDLSNGKTIAQKPGFVFQFFKKNSKRNVKI